MNENTERFYFAPEDKDKLQLQKLYLSAFSIDTFNEKRKKFYNSDIVNLNDESIRLIIRKVMSFKHPITRQVYFNIPTWTYVYKKGTRFFRVRKLDNKNIIDPPKDKIKCLNDVWNPPVEYVKSYGRLNYPHESLLYTSHKYPEICIMEMKISYQDRFALITYEAKEDITVTIVGYYQQNSDFTLEENTKFKVLTEFFFDVFTSEVNDENQHLYKLSSNLIKECYTIPDASQDGWVYPSIALKKGHNVCFKPEKAKQKLKLKGVEICKLDQRYGFVVNYVIEGLNRETDFKYHQIGSDKQKKLYPHLKLCE